MSEKKFPEFLFAVSDTDGNRLGLVAYADGVFASEPAAHAATVMFFAELAKTGTVITEAMPVSRMCISVTPSSLAEVLLDVAYANDCCALTLTDMPLASHVRDAEVTCERCHSSFRYVASDADGRLIWRWRLRNGIQRHEEDIMTLDAAYRMIKKHQADNAADEAESKSISQQIATD